MAGAAAGAHGDSSGMQTPLLNNHGDDDDETPLVNKSGRQKNKKKE